MRIRFPLIFSSLAVLTDASTLRDVGVHGVDGEPVSLRTISSGDTQEMHFTLGSEHPFETMMIVPPSANSMVCMNYYGSSPDERKRVIMDAHVAVYGQQGSSGFAENSVLVATCPDGDTYTIVNKMAPPVGWEQRACDYIHQLKQRMAQLSDADINLSDWW